MQVCLLLLSAIFATSARAEGGPALAPVVVSEETIATCLPPDNGAGPLWCFGAPLIYRDGEDVYASIMESSPEVKPLCNTRWRLFHRGKDGWELIRAAEAFRLREPSPLAGFPGGPLFLSTTPSVEPPGTEYGRCATELLIFDPKNLNSPPTVENPVWAGDPYFTDHSYRGFAVDGDRRELLWLNIDAKTSVLHSSFRNSEGKWVRQSSITHPIRSCYPQVALRNGAAHVLAVSDIVEPIEEWRKFKHEQSGRAWDYVFRKLYYSHVPDVAAQDFSDPLEIDNVDATAGHLSNLDLWIAPDGASHILYIRSNTTPVLRDRHFPGLPQLRSLEYVVVREGKVARRQMLHISGEGLATGPVTYGRFHSTPDGRLWAVYFGESPNEFGAMETALHLMTVYPDLDREHPVRVHLKDNFSTFFTATERGGSRPSYTLDLFGVTRDSTVLSHARIDLLGKTE